MANINRDYLIINDVKKSNVKLDNGSMNFYITDKNTQNIFVNLVINTSKNELITKYANIENADDYTVTMNIVKPDNTYKVIDGTLHSKEEAIFEFDLPADCCDQVGTYRCELLTKCNINSREEITTSNKVSYKVKASVLNDLDDIVDAPEYPLVIQLFDKLSDIDQYEEDRRANEIARQLAEEQRQQRFDNLIEALEIDNEERDSKIANLEANDITQNNKLSNLEAENVVVQNEIATIKSKNEEQDRRLDIAENRLDNINTNIENVLQPTVQRVDAIETINVTQNNRLDAIEAKNQQQDDRLLDIEKANKKQDRDINCLFNLHTVDITEEGNDVYLQNSAEGYCEIDNIQGDTLVNCNKEPNKELILNGNINTSGDNTVTITEGVDGGLVDVALEGNTLVNVSKTKDSTAITKAYTVENSGNHVALQGDIDGNCRPVVTGNTLANLNTNVLLISDNVKYDYKLSYSLKKNTLYTIILDLSYTTTGGANIWCGFLNNEINDWRGRLFDLSVGIKVYKLTTTDNDDVGDRFRIGWQSDVVSNVTVNNLIILEGDYADKPIPNYFEGLQSSFEDNLVTQEMVDNGEDVADNLGKYRVDYKVTGKNKFNPIWEDGYAIGYDNGQLYTSSGWSATSNYTKVTPGKTYRMNVPSSVSTFFAVKYDKDFKSMGGSQCWDIVNVSQGCEYLRFYVTTSNKDKFTQLEESNVTTPYELYKEDIKTYYLNSPLLEGDTIEAKDGGIYHVHRSELAAYTAGDETSLITDKVNTLHRLETPRYELIEQSNLVIPSYANGHLDLTSAVPVEKVDFLPFDEDLTYLYANTQYTLQFISYKAITADITLGGTQLLAQSIVKGLNRITITTPATLVDNKLIINGVGANISEVVVTDTNREFGYFEGMKSVGECEELEIISTNSDNSLSNTQQLPHEPLRAVGGVKDRYVLIDGKWHIERKCGSVVFDGSDDENINRFNFESGDLQTRTLGFSIPEPKAKTKYSLENFRCDKLKFVTDIWGKYQDYQGISGNNLSEFLFRINKAELQTQDIAGFRQWLQQNPVTVVYEIATPYYEPINYNPFEVYSGVTHITTNSTIPTNITVKNHGFNCLLKPSTTYTISSNLGLNTVTTPESLTEDCLRFMDTDTSNVTTMKNVLVLEGNWTTKPDLIPANFSGIQSCFEQEYDAEKGKYKVNIKVANEDKTKENSITFYINEPLRGVGTAKDKVFIKDDKIMVQRNCGSVTLDGSDDEGWRLERTNIYNRYSYQTELTYLGKGISTELGNDICNNFIHTNEIWDEPSPYDKVYIWMDQLAISLNKNSIINSLDKFKQWLSENPTTVVYKLASPTYEEVEYDDVKLSVETFKNSTLFYNSNVPVTSAVRYTYSVPLVDTVTQTANISDQQDRMIIDMATQVAVMEMMLM